MNDKLTSNEVKIIIIGNGGVGKTSIVQRLLGNDFISSEDEMTSGIDISQWTTQNESQEKSLKLNLWDFGGQEIYHSTHQLFFTKKTIYLLVTDSRRDETEDDFFYWLNSIKFFGDSSPVFLVMNKIDQRYKDLPITTFKKHFSNVVGFNKVSCLNKFSDTIDVLKADILRLLEDENYFPKLNSQIPSSWMNVKNQIDTFRKENKFYITYDEFENLCEESKLNRKSSLQLSEYFHDIGFHLHFSRDLELRRKIFLNYEWLLGAIYKILNCPSVVKNRGTFTDEDLMKLWSEEDYEKVQPELISLMKLFELCFEVNRGIYLAPQLLSVEPIEFMFDEQEHILVFELHYEFLPKGIISRFIVKRNRDIYQRKYWLNGAILEYENTQALVEADNFKNKIFIKIQGAQKRELLSVIRKTFDEIHSTLNSILVEEMIPCPCSECSENKSPYLFSYNVLQRRIEHNKKTVECNLSFEEVSIKNILNGVSIPSEDVILKALDSISMKRIDSLTQTNMSDEH